MIIFKCKHCGSTDLSLTRDVNPNDKTSIFNHCLHAHEGHHRIKCKHCGRAGEPFIDMPDVNSNAIQDVETDQFQHWHEGHADLFIASIGHYRRSDDTLLGGGDTLFYAFWRALEYLQYYSVENVLHTKDDTYYLLEIRLFNPPAGMCREEFPYPQSIFDLGDFRSIEPLYTQKI